MTVQEKWYQGGPKERIGRACVRWKERPRGQGGTQCVAETGGGGGEMERVLAPQAEAVSMARRGTDTRSGENSSPPTPTAHPGRI